MTTDFLIKVEETFCSKGTLLEQLGENYCGVQQSFKPNPRGV